MTANFSPEVIEARRQYTSLFKVLKEEHRRAIDHVGLGRPCWDLVCEGKLIKDFEQRNNPNRSPWLPGRKRVEAYWSNLD